MFEFYREEEKNIQPSRPKFRILPWVHCVCSVSLSHALLKQQQQQQWTNLQPFDDCLLIAVLAGA